MSFKTYKVKVYTDGTTFWYLHDKFHRENGPAVEFANGGKFWYLHGKIHRSDGPAVEYVDGGKVWFLNGEVHREDGPAVEYINGHKEWWIHGVKLSEEEFNDRKNSCANKIITIDGKQYKLTEV